MKKIVLLSLALLASASFNVASAAKKKDKKAAEVKTVVPVKLVTPSDSLSYVAGMSMTNGLMPYLKQAFGVEEANMADFLEGFNEMIGSTNDPKAKAHAAGVAIANQLSGQMLIGIKKEFTDTPDSVVNAVLYRGFSDALTKDTTVFNVKTAENVFKAKREYNKSAKEEKLYGANRDAGKAFLAENAKKDSVVTLPSGLQYKVLVKGTGEIPTKTDKVLVNYEGKLIDGTVFDSSSKHGDKPASFRADQVIKGWTEALTMMPVGSKWQLFIPQELAYGERNAGQIKPYSTLVFNVELVGIDKPQTTIPATKITKAAKKTKKSKK